jgi:hypothetical protein
LTELKEGESPLVKRRGRGTIANFTLTTHGKTIQPWKDKHAEIMEWLRNASAMLGDTREELATFYKIEKDSPVYYEDALQADRKMKLAYFTSEKDGRQYDVAARLLPKDINLGDRVKLTIMGCCSIINVQPTKEEFLT